MELIELLYYFAWLIAGFYLGSIFEIRKFLLFMEETDKLLQEAFENIKHEHMKITTKCLVQKHEIDQLKLQISKTNNKGEM